MIEENKFIAQMGLLCSRFQRASDPAVMMMYKFILDEQLTTEQFTKGAIVVFTQDTFFPSPERLIEAALGELQSAASEQWVEMLNAAKENRASRLDSIAKAAIAEFGGTTAIRNLPDQNQLMRIRKEFLDGYTRRAREARMPKAQALPAGGMDHGN